MTHVAEACTSGSVIFLRITNSDTLSRRLCSLPVQIQAPSSDLEQIRMLLNHRSHISYASKVFVMAETYHKQQLSGTRNTDIST